MDKEKSKKEKKLIETEKNIERTKKNYRNVLEKIEDFIKAAGEFNCVTENNAPFVFPFANHLIMLLILFDSSLLKSGFFNAPALSSI